MFESNEGCLAGIGIAVLAIILLIVAFASGDWLDSVTFGHADVVWVIIIVVLIGLSFPKKQ